MTAPLCSCGRPLTVHAADEGTCCYVHGDGTPECPQPAHNATQRVYAAPDRAALAARLTDAVAGWHDRDDDTPNLQGNLSRRIVRGNELASLAGKAAALLAAPESTTSPNVISSPVVVGALTEALLDLDLCDDAGDAASTADEILTRLRLRRENPILPTVEPPTTRWSVMLTDEEREEAHAQFRRLDAAGDPHALDKLLLHWAYRLRPRFAAALAAMKEEG